MPELSRVRVAIATATTLPEPDTDEPALVAALRARGAEVDVLAWDDPGAPFDRADVVVIRSTWNYLHRRDDFVAWAARVGAATRLLNPAEVVRANTDKIYLRALEARGVPIVPTLFVDAGETLDLAPALEARGWADVVIKPRVSAGSFATRRFDARARGQAAAFLLEHAPRRPMMIQPYLRDVEGRGERSLVWIDGELSHAVRKSVRLAGPGGAAGEHGTTAVPIEEAERALATDALRAIEADLLYARVDVVRDDAGGVRLMELELTEPSLFLDARPGATERLAAAILERAR